MVWRLLLCPEATCQSSLSVRLKLPLSTLLLSSTGWLVQTKHQEWSWAHTTLCMHQGIFFRKTLTGERKNMPRSKLTDLCASPDQCTHRFYIPQWWGTHGSSKKYIWPSIFWVGSIYYLNETLWNFQETWRKGILLEEDWVSPRKEKKIQL